MDIFQALRADHEVQRDLLEKLVATQGASDERKALFSRLKTELEAHAAAEEREFYAPLMHEDLTQDKSRHGVAEHFQIDCLLKKLEQYEWDAPAWLQTARELKDKVEHHLEEEEHELFQMAGKVLSDAKKSGLAHSYQQEMERQRHAD
ncbi:hemerythrin domain-containing protein [Alkalisalibacterium limincola]|uniref:Hemerythrin domain-containing protein n=1 Tax=Alkalisalibacterium limincola TaxID=2699169 RepID=A0A5C8KYU4_9GAMM|nr:hemerythrin domain-containing protein [Alkalisalibacterium limincola]TXK66006.1 hemerythrin domain-containing protein [Alkalisalibacterium limincola]